jgi:hypothetical protein
MLIFYLISSSIYDLVICDCRKEKLGAWPNHLWHEIRKKFNDMSYSHGIGIKCEHMVITGKGRKLRSVILLMNMCRRSWLMASTFYLMNLSIRRDIADCRRLECTSFEQFRIYVKTSDSDRSVRVG